ncbi:MAG: leucyl aminopeptidase family protein [Candidatus Moeniiplasma glomeromycotorum]|nr:leucyl aminopeptidase family protein [Candidatus Moeniiplasma glomeromycotorum]
MTNLFIQKEPKINLLTLRAITNKDKVHPLIEKKEWKTTLISEKNICYLYLNKENKDYNFSSIYDYFINFSSIYERDLNIDIQSFISKNLSEELIIQAISEGILFGTHQSIKFKKKEEKKKDSNYYLITKNKKGVEILDNSLGKLQAVNWARDLQDAPPNKLHAKEFAEAVKNKFNKLKNIEVEILDKQQIEKNKMGLLLAVNAGSHHEPRVVILRYFGDKKNKKNVLGLVGKGITFDSGGYDLKPSSSLQCMKFDMSGAAVVCASFLALAEKKPKLNAVAVACLTENAIGGHATLTESVITSMSEKTIEINNTDAEGRLVLADGITYAIQKEKATKIITVATLTGACVLALGENTTGIMTNNREFYQQFSQASQRSYEKIWELPLFSENTKNLKENTTIADISNISKTRYMGASNGAAFLQEFVENLPFIHCDIAGTAWKSKSKRGTGVLVKTLFELFITIE